jgi:hypothetical protein
MASAGVSGILRGFWAFDPLGIAYSVITVQSTPVQLADSPQFHDLQLAAQSSKSHRANISPERVLDGRDCVSASRLHPINANEGKCLRVFPQPGKS